MKARIEEANAGELFEHDIMELFEELSFHEKWRRVIQGLRMPPHTGDYKWAKLQVTRLWSPVAGVIVPMLLLLVVAMLAGVARPVREPHVVKLLDPDLKPELLVDTPPLDTKPPDPPDPREVDTPDPFRDQDLTMEKVEPDPPDVFAPQPARFESVARIKSKVYMSGIYADRDPGGRGGALVRGIAPGGVECAVLRALRWLKKNQNGDGSWDACKPAMTGLSLLTFLAHGETPASDEFGMTVEYAIKWLIENQEEDGRFRGRDGHDYSQPIAAYALAEAYGLTRVPMVKNAAEKAVMVVIKGQNPGGGFNYNLVPGGTPDRDDTSYMGWCVQALKAAYIAGLACEGLDAAMTKAAAGFRKNYAGTYEQGGFGYTGPSVDHGLSAVGALSLQLLGRGDDREVSSAMRAMANAGFWGKGGYSKMYYSYYLTQAKFHEGDVTWKNWNRIFAPRLIQEQLVERAAITGPDGKPEDIGHWAPGREISGHTDEEGRVMNTCLAALQLEVYYRYLPTFNKPDAAPLRNILNEKDADIDIRINDV